MSLAEKVIKFGVNTAIVAAFAGVVVGTVYVYKYCKRKSDEIKTRNEIRTRFEQKLLYDGYEKIGAEYVPLDKEGKRRDTTPEEAAKMYEALNGKSE